MGLLFHFTYMVCFGMNFLRRMFRAGVIGMAIVNPLPPCFGGRHSTVNGSDKSVQNGSIYLPNVTTLIKKRFGNEKPFVTND